jgi:hypothetical protein
MLLVMASASGCGVAEQFAAVRAFLVPPPLTRVDASVRPLGSIDEGISNLTRNAIQDALFAAQAGNRTRTLAFLQSTQALLANGPAPVAGPLTAENASQMISDLEAGRISAQTVAERLQAAVSSLAPPPTPPH